MQDVFKLPEIILASTSPRRQMLLSQVRIPFKVIPPTAREIYPINGNFAEAVIKNAVSKAESVIGKACGNIILGADTIVDLDGKPLGKPTDAAEARRMLCSLSGRTHVVHTGVALVNPDRRISRTLHSMTKVTFRTLDADEIDAYIASGEPFDKAGSYGIQGSGALFIERIDGCFFNVMGLPLAATWELLKKTIIEFTE